MAKRSTSNSKHITKSIEEKYEYDDEPEALDDMIASESVLKRDWEEDVVVDTKELHYNKLRCLIGHVKMVGPASGEQYEWARAGAAIDVLVEDVPGLLAKRLGNKSCCGATPDSNKFFELVE